MLARTHPARDQTAHDVVDTVVDLTMAQYPILEEEQLLFAVASGVLVHQLPERDRGPGLQLAQPHEPRDHTCRFPEHGIGGASDRLRCTDQIPAGLCADPCGRPHTMDDTRREADTGATKRVAVVVHLLDQFGLIGRTVLPSNPLRGGGPRAGAGGRSDYESEMPDRKR